MTKKQTLTIEEEDKVLLDELQNKIGVKFKQLKNLKEALVHKSYVNEQRIDKILSFERLEFLGDAVLEVIVSDYLFKKFPLLPEGKLTSYRAALVRTESLAVMARRIDLGKYLFMSKGESLTGGRDREYIMANAFEALLGAIYKDKGIKECEKFLSQFFFENLQKIIDEHLEVDAKSQLQEITQEVIKAAPKYTLLSAVGPDHRKQFTMQASINGIAIGQGSGNNKQEAEQNAASNSLEKILSMDKDAMVAKFALLKS